VEAIAVGQKEKNLGFITGVGPGEELLEDCTQHVVRYDVVPHPECSGR
jgi:hypothetical protein